MRRHHLIVPAVITCFLIAFNVAPVKSQITDDISRLQEEIGRNGELLQTAKELVSETNSVKARTSLHAAAYLHGESVRALSLLLDVGPGGGRFLRAATFAKKAREAILQTIALAKREARLEEGAAKAIERATHRFEQARQLISESDSRAAIPARKFAEEAHEQLQRSRDNMREHLYEIALRLAVSSEQLSSRAIAMIKRDFFDLESVERAIEKTDQILQRVGEEMPPDAPPQVRRMFQEARELQRKAKEKLREDKPRVALELTRKARNFAMRALKLLASRADGENVQRAIRLTDALLAEAKEIARERNAERLARRIEHAEQAQSQAKDLFDRGKYERALRSTLRAREILKDALSSIRRTLDGDEVRAALLQTDEILEKLGAALADSDDALAEDIFVRARSKQDRAWEEFRRDRLRAALANTRLARKLANRAFRRLNNEDL